MEQTEYDTIRTKLLQSKGYKVICFWNNDVSNNMNAVLPAIWEALPESVVLHGLKPLSQKPKADEAKRLVRFIKFSRPGLERSLSLLQ